MDRKQTLPRLPETPRLPPKGLPVRFLRLRFHGNEVIINLNEPLLKKLKDRVTWAII